MKIKGMLGPLSSQIQDKLKLQEPNQQPKSQLGPVGGLIGGLSPDVLSQNRLSQPPTTQPNVAGGLIGGAIPNLNEVKNNALSMLNKQKEMEANARAAAASEKQKEIQSNTNQSPYLEMKSYQTIDTTPRPPVTPRLNEYGQPLQYTTNRWGLLPTISPIQYFFDPSKLKQARKIPNRGADPERFKKISNFLRPRGR